MPKNSSDISNQLKINELPPPILEEAENVLTSDEALSEPQFGYYIINMMWRMLDALPSDDEFRFYEKNVLEDVLRYGSIDMIAKLNKVSPQTIRAKIKNALARYEDLVRKLEINKDQSDRINQLEEKLAVALSSPIPLYLREPYKPLQTYDFLKISPALLKKLNNKGIYTLCDLLTCSDIKFKSMFGLYSKAVYDLNESLSSMRLCVGMFNPYNADYREDEMKHLKAKVADLTEQLKSAPKIANKVSNRGDKLEEISQRHKQSEEKLKNAIEFKESIFKGRINMLEKDLDAALEEINELRSKNPVEKQTTENGEKVISKLNNQIGTLKSQLSQQKKLTLKRERAIRSLNKKVDALKLKIKKVPTYEVRLEQMEQRHKKSEEKLNRVFDFKLSTYKIRNQVLEDDLAAAREEIAKLKSKIKESNQ